MSAPRGRVEGVAALELALLAEGYQRGTPTFESALLRRKVAACQAQKQVPDCEQCGYFDHCETAKAHLVDLRYNRGPTTTKELVVQDRLPDWLSPAELTSHESPKGDPGPTGKR